MGAITLGLIVIALTIGAFEARRCWRISRVGPGTSEDTKA